MARITHITDLHGEQTTQEERDRKIDEIIDAVNGLLGNPVKEPIYKDPVE